MLFRRLKIWHASARQARINATQMERDPDTELDPKRAEFMAYAEDPLQTAASYARTIENTHPSAEERSKAHMIGRAMLRDAAKMADEAGFEYDLYGWSDIGVDTLLDQKVVAADPQDPNWHGGIPSQLK